MIIWLETMTVNDLSIDGRNSESFSAGEMLPLEPSSSFLDAKNLDARKGDNPMASFNAVNAVRSAGKLEQDLQTRIAVIDENALSRSCLMRCLSAPETNFMATGYSSVEQWQQTESQASTPIVLLCATGRKSTEAAVRRDLELVVQAAPEARVIVVSDFEESTEIVGALERGARGFIAMSSNLDVAMAAIRLVAAGGTFVPASGLMSSRSPGPSAIAEMDAGSRRASNHFTPKQLEVIDRLRQGEPNKIIAYKLNMGECTVKVHVRNIMRKIKARNRTEIAFLTNELF